MCCSPKNQYIFVKPLELPLAQSTFLLPKKVYFKPHNSKLGTFILSYVSETKNTSIVKG